MRVYLQAKYGRRAFMREVAEYLRGGGHEVTSTWVTDTSLPDEEVRITPELLTATLEKWAVQNVRDLMRSDTVFAFTERASARPDTKRGGRHVEFGMAWMLKKKCVVIGIRENVFHHLPGVLHFMDWSYAQMGMPGIVACKTGGIANLRVGGAADHFDVQFNFNGVERLVLECNSRIADLESDNYDLGLISEQYHHLLSVADQELNAAGIPESEGGRPLSVERRIAMLRERLEKAEEGLIQHQTLEMDRLRGAG